MLRVVNELQFVPVDFGQHCRCGVNHLVGRKRAVIDLVRDLLGNVVQISLGRLGLADRDVFFAQIEAFFEAEVFQRGGDLRVLAGKRRVLVHRLHVSVDRRKLLPDSVERVAGVAGRGLPVCSVVLGLPFDGNGGNVQSRIGSPAEEHVALACRNFFAEVEGRRAALVERLRYLEGVRHVRDRLALGCVRVVGQRHLTEHMYGGAVLELLPLAILEHDLRRNLRIAYSSQRVVVGILGSREIACGLEDQIRGRIAHGHDIILALVVGN